MNKVKLCALLLALLVSVSCTQMKTAVNIISDKPYEQPKMPIADVPQNNQNAVADEHLGDAKAIVVSVTVGRTLYLADLEYPREVLGEVIAKRLRENPSEKQLIYLNSDRFTEYGEIVQALDIIRKSKIENIGLRVAPKSDNAKQFHILKVKISPEPTEDDTTDYTKNQILNLDKEGKINFVGYDKNLTIKIEKPEIKPEELAAKITERLKNKPDKTLYIKAARSNRYSDVVRLVDAAAGAGASVILQIDDLYE
jgi:biopolymer transport protein ExbD